MVPGEAVWAVGCATFVRDAQAMLPDPHDKPTPEPDDDLEDDPQDESDTLYFGREDGCTARCCRSPTSRPGREAAMAEGAASGSFGGLYIPTPFF